MLPPASTTAAIQELHRVVRTFQVLYASAEDFIEDIVVSIGLPSVMFSTDICIAQSHLTQDGQQHEVRKE